MRVLTTTLLAAVVVVLVPGLAAIAWTAQSARQGTADAGADLAERISLAYAGVGIACIALWLTTATIGMSRWTSFAAPLAGAAIVALAARLGRGRPLDAHGPLSSADVHAGASRTSRRRVATTLTALSLVSVCLVAIPFAPYGWERADGIHRMAMTDWEKHLRMAITILGSPTFPPAHPYIHADPNPSYYFGYHLVAAAIASVGGRSVHPFAALWLLTLATAAATPFVVYTFARDLCTSRQAVRAAAASTLLIGFDLVPLALQAVKAAAAVWPPPAGLAGLRAIIPSTHIDFWIDNIDRQFSAPVVATMWAPHQTAAALISLIVLYLLAPQPEAPDRSRARWFLPALLIAALAGLSSYMALGLAVGVASAAVLEAVSERRAPWGTATFRRWWLPGAIGVLLALPIVPVVTRGSSSGLILSTSVAGTWSNGAIFSWLFGAHQWTNLLDTPAVFLVDFGVIGVLGVIQIVRLRRARTMTPVQQQAAAVAVAIMLLVTFVRPPVGIGNNLYARALLLSWFVLAPFAAMPASGARRSWVGGAALVCALGTCYAEVGYLLEGGLFWATPKATVEAFRWVNDATPRSALVAIRPGDYESNDGYWLERPVVLGGRRLALLFGANPDRYDRTSLALEAAFAETDAEAARRDFDALDADVILVRRSDPPWAVGPCFDVAHRNADWTVVLRDRRACPPMAAPGSNR